MKSIICIIIITMFPLPSLAETFKDSFNDRNLIGWRRYPEKGIWENRNGAVDIRIPASDNPQNIPDQMYFLTLVNRDCGEYTLSCKVMANILYLRGGGRSCSGNAFWQSEVRSPLLDSGV